MDEAAQSDTHTTQPAGMRLIMISPGANSAEVVTTGNDLIVHDGGDFANKN
jgi:hypothetical protein